MLAVHGRSSVHTALLLIHTSKPLRPFVMNAEPMASHKAELFSLYAASQHGLAAMWLRKRRVES
jgi:hypothetical protein